MGYERSCVVREEHQRRRFHFANVLLQGSADLVSRKLGSQSSQSILKRAPGTVNANGYCLEILAAGNEFVEHPRLPETPGALGLEKYQYRRLASVLIEIVFRCDLV
tara:strand:- start:12 stop:329 length:318 start_codon:yes stop_codon:yes gene_type:complete